MWSVHQTTPLQVRYFGESAAPAGEEILIEGKDDDKFADRRFAVPIVTGSLFCFDLNGTLVKGPRDGVLMINTRTKQVILPSRLKQEFLRARVTADSPDAEVAALRPAIEGLVVPREEMFYDESLLKTIVRYLKFADEAGNRIAVTTNSGEQFAKNWRLVRYDEIVRRATGDNDWQLFSGARILEQLLDPAIANSPEWRTVNNGKPPLFVEDQRPNAFGGKAVHILEAMQALEFDNMQNVFLFDDSVRNVTGVVNALRTVRSKIVWTQEGLTKEIWETILRQHAE